MLDLLSSMERRVAEHEKLFARVERSYGSRLAELEHEIRMGKALRDLQARVDQLEQERVSSAQH